MKNAVPRRAVIYAKDIENITGRKRTAARQLLRKIRDHFNKQRTEFLTVREFCQYTGIAEEMVYPLLRD
jgi:hypothetical protein